MQPADVERATLIPRWLRVCFGRVHERMLGRSTFADAAELELSQWYAPSDVRHLQAEKLRALLIHLASRIPFYAGRVPGDIEWLHDADPFPLLDELPMLDKATIRSERAALTWSRCPGGLHRSSTGGSTGEPLTFFLDRRRQAYDQAARMRSHRWFGVKFGEPEVFVWGSPIENGHQVRLKRWRDRLWNHHLLNAFDMSPGRVRSYWDAIERIRPTCLFGYPSSLALLAQAKPRSARLPGLKVVFVTGEVCYPHHRSQIEEAFGVAVANGYGSREAGFIAHECPEGSLHITAENVIVEVVRTGRVVRPGESGEIVVTHLDAYGMPFVRYRTGDMGRLRPGRCACGRGLPMMDVVEGRTTDFVVLPDGTVKHALSMIYPLREIESIERFRVVQGEDYSLVVDFTAEARARRDELCVEIERKVGSVVGHAVPVRGRAVDHLPPLESGKHHYVVSRAASKRAVTWEGGESDG